MSILKIFKKILFKLFTSIFPYNFFYFSHKGYCPCCDKNVVFRSFNDWLRDNFRCSKCGSIPRQRALMLIIEKYYPEWRGLSIHESSPGEGGASQKLKMNAAGYITSQYYPAEKRGLYLNGHKNEDLENQTFGNEEFDLVISQDVMEHVYDPGKAFSEIARTLKSGGAHIFTVPIVNKFNKTEIWAKKGSDGKPVFLKNPEYHFNPVDPLGSPVTMHWGYDIVDFIKETSGLETTVEYIDNLDYGIRAEFIEVLISKKI
jgi:SAM-dependent methyltransferase